MIKLKDILLEGKMSKEEIQNYLLNKYGS